MKIVQKIKEPIKEEMEVFEKKFKNSMMSKISLLNRITFFIVKRKGKQIRPMFVFLVAKLMGNGKIDERSYRGAALIELIHTATLVHDDIVDDSYKRRGFFSINALWKNKIAVLVGDYLFSKGLLLSVDNEDFDLLKIISKAVKEMSEGELLQLEKSRNFEITENVYYEIIKKKTAVLIASCCSIGATSVVSTQNEIDKIYQFGELLGMIFQIKDDLFDYSDKIIGKPTGIDLKEKKITLPFIYAINNVNIKEKKWLINSFKNSNKGKKNINKIIKKVIDVGGLEFSIKKMNFFKKKALKILFSFPKNKYRDSLELIVDYIIERKI
ncbi:MAG: polyprenyl synthetase [Flavobacteriaceae bacterium]|nr:polyprenyl synthetase [Flavobacteriaceae bacterium]|tara:strand:- start:36034 stop:37011 length:978 start_codon:yes stop_codon:yes gene_type:complete